MVVLVHFIVLHVPDLGVEVAGFSFSFHPIGMVSSRLVRVEREDGVSRIADSVEQAKVSD
jgi:hypothetical protein